MSVKNVLAHIGFERLESVRTAVHVCKLTGWLLCLHGRGIATWIIRLLFRHHQSRCRFPDKNTPDPDGRGMGYSDHDGWKGKHDDDSIFFFLLRSNSIKPTKQFLNFFCFN